MYKKLRNRDNSQLKKDNMNFNSVTVKAANDENEMWKVVKEVTSPRSNSNITLIEGGVTIEDDLEVTELFDSFFAKKIETHKNNIDVSMVEDLLDRLEQKILTGEKALKNFDFAICVLRY